MNYFLKLYIVSLSVFLGIDFLWLGFIARKLYQKYLGYIMTDKVVWGAAILFYLIFISGLTFFVVDPALKGKGAGYALYTGAFFGFIAYATYDLTNLATIKDWPLIVTVLDLIWGAFISGSTALLTVLIIKKFLI